MLKKITKAVVLAALSLALPFAAHAAGLGKLTLLSALGQPPGRFDDVLYFIYEFFVCNIGKQRNVNYPFIVRILQLHEPWCIHTAEDLLDLLRKQRFTRLQAHRDLTQACR